MKKTKTTPKQEKYVQARAKGQSRGQSAIIAGYAVEGLESPALSKIEGTPTVQERLAEIRAETAKNTKVTKEDVVQMLLDAAEMARVMADPNGMVAAARELGKMLGFYAPEVKKVTHGLDKGSLRQVMEELSDEDLQRLANSRAITSTATRVLEDKSDGSQTDA